MAALTASPAALQVPDAVAASSSGALPLDHDASSAQHVRIPLLSGGACEQHTNDGDGSAAMVDDATSEPSTALREMADAIAAFMVNCATTDGAVTLQALSYATWLLRELTEPEHVVSDTSRLPASSPTVPLSCRLVSTMQADALRSAAAAAAGALASHVRGPWADAIAPLLHAQWRLAGRVGETPALGDEHVAALLFLSSFHAAPLAAAAGCAGTQAPTRSTPAATAPAADHVLEAVRRWIVLHSACAVACGVTPGAAPPVAAARSDYVVAGDELREGAIAPSVVADGVPCRVAFERGKERHVLLTAAACAVAGPALATAGGDSSCVTSLLLLTDAAPVARPSEETNSATASVEGAVVSSTCAGSVVRAVAPAAGAEVRAASCSEHLSRRQFRVLT